MTLFVAELGQPPSHAEAVDMMSDLAEAGADAVKVQILDPHHIAHESARKYWPHGDDRTQREVYADNGTLDWREWENMRDYARAISLGFFATPFDVDSVKTCADLEVDAIKIASGDITNLQLLDAAVDTGIPLVISTGAATWVDIDRLIDRYGGLPNQETTFLACSLQYPTPLHNACLGRITDLEMGLNIRDITAGVGYSDHTLGTRLAHQLGVTGVRMVEKHVAFGDPSDDGNPDNEIGLTPKQFDKYIRRFFRARETLGGGLGVHHGEEAAHHGARRSLWYRADFPPVHPGFSGRFVSPDGEVHGVSFDKVVDAADFAQVLRPGPKPGQLSAADWDIVRRPDVRLVRAVKAGDPVMWADLHIPD